MGFFFLDSKAKRPIPLAGLGKEFFFFFEKKWKKLFDKQNAYKYKECEM